MVQNGINFLIRGWSGIDCKYLSRPALKEFVAHPVMFLIYLGMALNKRGPFTDKLANLRFCTRTEADVWT